VGTIPLPFVHQINSNMVFCANCLFVVLFGIFIKSFIEIFSGIYCIFLLVSIRLKSVKNIQKITKSMKMVSAAKYAKAERELKPARAYGEGAYGRLT
jgi:hypothetical protein